MTDDEKKALCELIPLEGSVGCVTYDEDKMFTVDKIVVHKTPFTIGRDFGGDYKSNNPAVSSVHCVIEEKDGKLVLVDNSRNGVYVKGKRIGRGNEAVLEHGDEVLLVRSQGEQLKKFDMGYRVNDLQKHEAQLKLDIHAYYFLDDTIGKGAYAEVKRATERSTGAQVAVKVIMRKKLELISASITLEKQWQEVAILRKINHPSIIKVLDVFVTYECIHLVMELAMGGDLFDLIKKRGTICEDDAKVVFRQLASAVEYLHGLGVAHRDIKPENILLGEPDNVHSIKLTDFGLAKVFGGGVENALKTMCGTPMYVAPEVLKRGVVTVNYTEQVDIWSLGIVLWVMVTAKPPFPRKRLPNGSVSKNLDFERPLDMSTPPLPRLTQHFRDLIQGLVVTDPARRMTMSEINAHPWLATEEPADLNPAKKRPGDI
eukprot:TRINITY_DN23427_c0_g1_i1.p1 TRINITY_DN23427_c0_g1~~TRINITY_DN23427_c0_g1_i1.p1  ORF type:complete len:443 (+),score=123.01 TRINITY_DN23427_c0_g1_i1:42-1331(+)